MLKIISYRYKAVKSQPSNNKHVFNTLKMLKTNLIYFFIIFNIKNVLTQFYLNNGNYLSYPIKMNWFEAMAKCNSLNQQLIVVNTEEKLQKIQYMINAMNFSQSK